MKPGFCWGTVALLTALLGGTPIAADGGKVAKAEAIIARSKFSRATYAVYFWNRLYRPGEQPQEEWSAEFNAGNLHRVETPRDLVVADCAQMTGTWVSLVSRNVSTGSPVAAAACGIATNIPAVQEEWLGRVSSRFGKADRVRVTDTEKIRTYDIADNGIILRTLYQTNDARRRILLESEAVAISTRLPKGALFDRASLSHSVVPDTYKKRP